MTPIHDDFENLFRGFTNDLIRDGWISCAKFFCADVPELLRAKMGEARKSPQVSRTHKEGLDGTHVGFEAETTPPSAIGVDLELFHPRRILTGQGDWLIGRLHITGEVSPRELLQEWTRREASVKALGRALGRSDILVAQFRPTEDGMLKFVGEVPNGYVVETKSHWAGDWVLTVARL